MIVLAGPFAHIYTWSPWQREYEAIDVQYRTFAAFVHGCWTTVKIVREFEPYIYSTACSMRLDSIVRGFSTKSAALMVDEDILIIKTSKIEFGHAFDRETRRRMSHGWRGGRRASQWIADMTLICVVGAPRA